MARSSRFYDPNDDVEIHTAQTRLCVNRLGGRLLSWQTRLKDQTWGTVTASETEKSPSHSLFRGCVMAPWCGRNKVTGWTPPGDSVGSSDGALVVPVGRGLGVGGLVSELRWEIVSKRFNEVRMGCEVGPCLEYPRKVRIVVSYRVGPAAGASAVPAGDVGPPDSVVITVSATSLETRLLAPVVLGVCVPMRPPSGAPVNDVSLLVRAGEEYLVDNDLVPCGTAKGRLIHDYNQSKRINTTTLDATYKVMTSLTQFVVQKLGVVNDDKRLEELASGGAELLAKQLQSTAQRQTITFKEVAVVRSGGFELGVKALKNCTHLHVKTTEDRSEILLTPASGPPDALRSGHAVLLPPGETFELQLALTVTHFDQTAVVI